MDAAVGNDRSESNADKLKGKRSAWSGSDRRDRSDRREDNRRLDERRTAGIGEVIDDRRTRRGRRTTDRRTTGGRRGER